MIDSGDIGEIVWKLVGNWLEIGRFGVDVVQFRRNLIRFWLNSLKNYRN